MWTKSTDPGARSFQDIEFSHRGIRRLSVRTGGIIGDDVIMIVQENTHDGETRRIPMDSEQATKLVQELQKFINAGDDFRENYKEVV